MAVAMEARLDGVDRAEATLMRIAGGLQDRQPLMEGIGLYLESSTIERFDTETAPDGSKWKPSQRVIGSSVGKYGPQARSGKTLTDKGHLKGSITYIATNVAVQWGSNMIYARPHQLGWHGEEQVGAHSRTIQTAFGKLLKSPITYEVSPFTRQANLPARTFLGINDEDEAQIIGLAEDYVAQLSEGEAQ